MTLKEESYGSRLEELEGILPHSVVVSSLQNFFFAKASHRSGKRGSFSRKAHAPCKERGRCTVKGASVLCVLSLTAAAIAVAAVTYKDVTNLT